MRRAAKIYFCSAVFLIFLSGCQPEGIIPPKDMSSLIASFYEADATIDLVQEGAPSRANFDSLRVYRPLLEARGYCDEDFRRSLEYYLHEPKKLVKVFTQAHEELQKLADNQSAALLGAEERGDTMDRDATEREPQVLHELLEGAEPAIEKLDEPTDASTRPERKQPQRRQRKKMTKQELKQLEEELK